MIITSNHVTKQIAGAFVVKQVHDLWNALEWYSSMLCYTGSYVYCLSLRITSQSTMQIVSAFVVKQVHDLWNLINCLIVL